MVVHVDEGHGLLWGGNDSLRSSLKVQVHEASSSEALLTSVFHSLHVPDVTGGDVTINLVRVVLLVVVGLLSGLGVVVVVVNVLNIVVF